MEKFAILAAGVIVALWAASIIVSLFLPERKLEPSVQVAMVAATTFLFGSAYVARRK